MATNRLQEVSRQPRPKSGVGSRGGGGWDACPNVPVVVLVPAFLLLLRDELFTAPPESAFWRRRKQAGTDVFRFVVPLAGFLVVG